MFLQARIKLTIWYVSIMLIVSAIFSLAFYNASTKEIDRIMQRLEFEEMQTVDFFRPPKRLNAPSIEELLAYKNRIIYELILVNAIVFFSSAFLSYLLAGKTLHPIRIMMNEQERFISDASHELRTPIATLRAEMESQLMEKNITDFSARKLIISNLEEITHLQKLTDYLLSLTHIHNSSSENIIRRKCDLNSIINQAIKKINSSAKKKSIQIIYQKNEQFISGDELQLIELFVIMLDNAVKYSPANSKIGIKIVKKQQYIKVIISDQGVGIDQNDLPHIFERFYRADTSRSKTKGYGIGLAIAKNIINNHQGKIEIDSQVGKGTTFTLTFDS